MEETKDELVKVPASTHGHFNAARSVSAMKLSNLATEVNPYLAMLGSDKFTEMYIKTASGNIYRIKKEKHLGWVLQNMRKSNTNYVFAQTELHYSEVSLGKSFYYGNGGKTSEVTEIIAVCTGKMYGNLRAPISEIPKKFKQIFKFKF